MWDTENKCLTQASRTHERAVKTLIEEPQPVLTRTFARTFENRRTKGGFSDDERNQKN